MRNLLRLVDNLPGVYLLGLVCILATPRNQRLGNLAADAVVVYDRRDRGSRRRRAIHTGVVDDPAPAGVWDVSAVSADDLATVRTFLQRRHDLEPDARRHLAADLAARLRPKVSSGSAVPDDEGFLTQLVEVKSARI